MNISISKSNRKYPDYLAKVIWEALFRETRAWEWASLMDFLDDLERIKTLIKEGKEIFYWYCDYAGDTNTNEYYKERFDCLCYKISILENMIQIERV